MRLRNAFLAKDLRFSRAIEENNLDDMKMLMTKDSASIISPFIDVKTYEKISPEMTTLLVEGMDSDLSARWGFDMHGGANYAKIVMLMCALDRGRTDLADILMTQKIDFNLKEFDTHPASLLLNGREAHGIPAKKQAEYLRGVLSSGTDKIKDADEFIWIAARSGYVDGLKILASVGFDLNKDNDKALRLAAEAGHRQACMYLTIGAKADIGRAVSIFDAQKGKEKTALFLCQLRNDLPAKLVEAPPTIEGLVAEVKELRAMVFNLSAVIEDLRKPEKNLNKKQLVPKKSF